MKFEEIVQRVVQETKLEHEKIKIILKGGTNVMTHFPKRNVHKILYFNCDWGSMKDKRQKGKILCKKKWGLILESVFTPP